MKLIRQLFSFADNITIKKETDELKLLLGNQAAKHSAHAESMRAAEFKVFSQWGDDGIIQYLIHRISISKEYFVEFGVENYTEANTRFLLMNNNWSGLVMDGSASHVDHIKKDSIYWKHDLRARQAFVTAENINTLLDEQEVPDRVGIFHIDIDGNDYWIWKNLQRVKADIVIVEYNSLFGPSRSITIPYQADFVRTKAHFSNLYYGCSVAALCDLAKEKGYSFVGCNSAGNNAYFVLNEKLGDLKALSPEDGFVNSRFRESRDEAGQLTFLSGGKREALIKKMPVYNTRTQQLETL